MVKNRMFKVLAIIAALLMMVSVVASCNNTTGNSAATGSPASTDSSAATQAPAESQAANATPASGSDDALKDKVTLVLGAQNFTNSADDKNFPNDWVKQMMADLNIDFSMVGYDVDKLNLALAGGDLPDLMMVNTNYVKQVVEGNLAVALDDYLQTDGPNILKYDVRNQVLRKYFSNGTGKLYFHTPSTGTENATGGTELWNGYIVRWDLYKQIGAPAMKTDDDYINVMKQMKAAYPQTENGDPVYAIGVHNDWGLWGWCFRSMANMGYNNLAHWGYAQNSKTNDIINNYLDYQTPSPFWNDMMFYYKLNQEGLLDPDSFTMKSEEVNEKAGKGQYLGGYCTWFLGNLYDNEKAKDPNTIKGFVAIPGEGQNGWYAGTSDCGWTDKDMFITSKCKNVQRAVRFLDYLDSPKANRNFYSGVQGTYWDYQDNKPVLKDTTMQLKAQGGDAWTKTGIYDGGWANFIGASGSTVDPDDGQPYDLLADVSVLKQTLNPLQKDFCSFYKVDVPAQLQYNMVQAGKAYNKSTEIPNIQACIAQLPDDITRIDTKCDEIINKAIPKLVNSKSIDEFNSNRDQVIADLKAAGAEDAWTWWQNQWKDAKSFFQGLVKR